MIMLCRGRKVGYAQISKDWEEEAPNESYD